MGMYLVQIEDEMDIAFVNTLLPAEKMYWTGKSLSINLIL